jgi:O-antigen ligase
VRTPTRTRTGTSAGTRSAPSETGLVVSLLMLIALVMLAPLMSFDTGPLTGGGNLARQAAYLATLGVAIVAIRPLQDPKRLLAMPWPLALVLAYCAITLTWSLAPGIGARRLLLTAVVVWAICLIVAHLPYRRFINTLRWALIITLVVNYLTVLLFPDWGIHQSNDGFSKDLIGTWRGFMIQKNYAGVACAVTFVTFAFDNEGMPKWTPPLAMVGSAIFLLMSESKTSFGIGLYAIAGGVVYMIQSPRYRALFLPVLFAAGLTALIGFAMFWRPINATMSNPVAFTGRVQIWQATAGYWRDHMWTGAGFGSFWNIGPDSPIYTYGRGYTTALTSGHNGFLDLLATVGLPGLALILFACVIFPLGKLLVNVTIPRKTGALLTAWVLFCIGHNSTETSLFERDQIPQVFLMFAIAFVVRFSTRDALADRGAAGRLWADLGVDRARA